MHKSMWNLRRKGYEESQYSCAHGLKGRRQRVFNASKLASDSLSRFWTLAGSCRCRTHLREMGTAAETVGGGKKGHHKHPRLSRRRRLQHGLHRKHQHKLMRSGTISFFTLRCIDAILSMSTAVATKHRRSCGENVSIRCRY